MTAPTVSESPSPSTARALAVAAAAGRSVVYGLALVPWGVGAFWLLAAGRRLVGPWWGRLPPPFEPAAAVGSPSADRVPGPVAVAAHAVASLLLGVAAVVPLRGLLYGLVDRGPYDNAWGGPSMAGAWLVHLALSIPLTAAALVVLLGLVTLHRRLTGMVRGERPPIWVAAARCSSRRWRSCS